MTPLPVQRICPPGLLPAEDLTCVPVGYWDDATVQVATPATLPVTGASDGRLGVAAGGLLAAGLALTVAARKRARS